MKAVELRTFEGPSGLHLVDVDVPRPSPNEVLIRVEAAGINYAELEQTRGRYPVPRPLPVRMGFEAAGVVTEVGESVTNLAVGDRVTGIASSGGFAEYATLDARAAIPVPPGMSFADATTLPIQGLSALALLGLAARPKEGETVLVQAAAGGVGLYLVQLAKRLGFSRVVALASSAEKLDLVRSLGADVAVDYTRPGWPERVREATGGRGVDVVLEMASGSVAEESFRLAAPFGRIVVFGASDMHLEIASGSVQRLIAGNNTIVFFNVPTVPVEALGGLVPDLLRLVTEGGVRIFAKDVYPLAESRRAFEALASRRTIGRVVLVP